METKTSNNSLNAILISIGLGIWMIVLQNAGIIPKLVGSKNGTQTVYVTGGNIDADVSGSVSVDNQVDVNLDAINGNSNCFYDFGGDGDYVRIPVMTTYPSR
jgi:hypothetical protein